MALLRKITLLALICGAATSAHEIGTSRVAVTFQDGAYRIEVITDGWSLGKKIAAATGVILADNATPDDLQKLLRSHDETFRERFQLAFNSPPVKPAIEYYVKPGSDAASGPVATIRMTGPVPSGASTFTWNYGWTFASYSLTLHDGSAKPATEWLEGNQTSAPFTLGAAQSSRPFTAWRYLLLGFTHILPLGFDHVLFVLGIYLLSGRPRTVLLQVSAFTVAHSITLGLSMYGLVHITPRVVEPMIAISIAYVAIENILLKELRSWRIALVFSFGLLHGMGFAGALREIGLPRSEFVTALVTFNLGVEMAQLAVIGTAFLLVGWHCANRTWYRSRVVVPASAMIGCTAVYWTIQRLWV